MGPEPGAAREGVPNSHVALGEAQSRLERRKKLDVGARSGVKSLIRFVRVQGRLGGPGEAWCGLANGAHCFHYELSPTDARWAINKMTVK